MGSVEASYSAVIAANPETIYSVLADYQVGHPAILPKPYFTRLQVDKGGVGAGTVIHVDMTVYGRDFHYYMEVTEPEPGRRLVETDHRTGMMSSFLLEPLDNGTRTRVTIQSRGPASPGLAGKIEQIITPLIMRSIYKKELQNLAEYVAKA